jgi:lipoprotein-releasing system permease protein
MRFEFFISRRYLASRERRGIISLITIISVGGVAVGVAALIVVIAVMDGFDEQLMNRMMGAWSHVVIQGAYNEPIRNYREVLAVVEKDPAVVAASPVLVRQALLYGGEPNLKVQEKVPVQVQGYDFAREPGVTKFMQSVLEDVGTSTPGQRQIVLGYVLIGRLSSRTRLLSVGAPVTALTALGEGAIRPMVKTVPLEIAGVFKTGLYDVDANVAYVSLEQAQRMFIFDEPRDVVDQIRLRVRDPYNVEPVINRISARLAPLRADFQYLPWYRLNPEFFSALKLEKYVMFVILLLIVLVAAFNIIGTLVMIVIEKTREIGILRSMGATQRQILSVFLLQGLIVGAMGISVGCAIGFAITWGLTQWPIELPPGVYGILYMPVLIRWETVAVIIASALAICLLASLLPAWRAAKLHPTTALRYE